MEIVETKHLSLPIKVNFNNSTEVSHLFFMYLQNFNLSLLSKEAQHVFFS